MSATYTADQRAGIVARTLLANQGRKQMDLGDYLGLDSAAISRALSGKRKWTLGEIDRAAEFFDVSVALFFDDPASLIRSRCVPLLNTPELVAA